MASPLDPRLSFDNAVNVYDEIRPSYPPPLFDRLFALLPARPRILEVGPGTGQATSDLLKRNATVHAVEIGPHMAAKLRSNHATERLVVSVGDFETHEFEPTRFDAVFSATAYHWISKNAQVDRPAELLTPGGVLAVVDLIQVDSPDDEGFFAAAQPIYDKYGQPHTGPTAPVRNNVDPTIRSTLAADTRFHNVAVDQFDWNQTYTAEQYRKLMLSYSVTQMMNEPQRTGLLDEIEALIQRDFGDSIITRPLVVTLTTAFLG